ncbi:MAG: nitroreductase family protein [Candidatus Thermoplasmatota archaeon]|nr:nitroreductase family protein [Candidatus Thermoplasmatota archaeon]
MNVEEAIQNRRAYRSLEPVEITDKMVEEMATAAQLAPSCYNNQPWRFVFVRSKKTLEALHGALSPGNDWAKHGSMIIAVFSREEDDCVIKERKYHQFDTGMAVGMLMLRATEMGLVAHPIAGYSPKKTREALGILEEYNVITLIIVGKHSQEPAPYLSEGQKEAENERPERKGLETFAYKDKYGKV